MCAIKRTCCFFNRSLNIVIWHIISFCFFDGRSKRRVGFHVASAIFSRNVYIFSVAHENFTSFSILSIFSVLDIAPLRMTSHEHSTIMKYPLLIYKKTIAALSRFCLYPTPHLYLEVTIFLQNLAESLRYERTKNPCRLTKGFYSVLKKFSKYLLIYCSTPDRSLPALISRI